MLTEQLINDVYNGFCQVGAFMLAENFIDDINGENDERRELALLDVIDELSEILDPCKLDELKAAHLNGERPKVPA